MHRSTKLIRASYKFIYHFYKVKAIMDEPSMALLDSVGVDFEELVRAYVEKTVNDIRTGGAVEGIEVVG